MAEITSVTATWLPNNTATISGSGFGGDEGYVNLVFENLGSILTCAVTDWTDTSITATLPEGGFAANEAVYLEVIGPNTNYFAVRSEQAVTDTPVIDPPVYLLGLTWVTVNPEVLPLLDPAPPVTLLTALGQVMSWDEEAEKYEVRWYPLIELDRPGSSLVDAADLGVVGGLTLSRALATGLLGGTRLIG